MTGNALPHRTCPDCCVTWHRGEGDDCWNCGRRGTPASAPVIGSQFGAGNAYTETQWAEVRRQVL